MRAHALVAAALLLSGAALLAGDWLAPPAAAQAVPTKDILVKDTAFQPPVVEVVKGTKVIWTNEDSGFGGLHTATEDGDDPAFDETLFPTEFSASGINKGEFTFEEVGVVKYHCEIHANMKGEVRVVEQLTAPVVKVEAKDDGNNRRFDPNVVPIDTSQKVNFTNKGNQLHNVRFEDTSLQGADLPPGRGYEVSITKEGTFLYRCTLHSPDFQSGMRGEIRVKAAPNEPLPPTVAITSPDDGSTVAGTLDIEGTVTSGAGQANVTNVEVRIGTDAPWAEAEHDAATGAWSFTWDTTKDTDGPKTVYARAPTADVAEPTPVSIDVVVKNTNDTQPTDGTPATSPSADAEGGDTPGFEAVLVALALLAAAVLRRRS